MDKRKAKRLQSAGWKAGSVKEFFGLSGEESAISSNSNWRVPSKNGRVGLAERFLTSCAARTGGSKMRLRSPGTQYRYYRGFPFRSREWDLQQLPEFGQ
jgi:hypothetical protein